ncbi:MAG: glycerol kinase GlpK [Acidobacteriaceae bacterium]|jgi:glycerol kinase
MRYVLALDQGTTSSRAILFDQKGQIAAVAQHEFPQIFPAPGWVEHSPADLLTSQITAAVEAMAKAGATPADVIALGIANQRETAIVWDKRTGKPICNAIVWQDRRTAPLCERLRNEGVEETVRRKTGLVLDPYFSASKVAWMLEHVDGARDRAERGCLAFGTVDTWLIWNLTGGTRHVTDRTNASRTLLYNIVEDRWDDDLLRIFGIPRKMLPEVCWSSERVGHVTAPLGPAGVEIAGIAGDQQAALFGQLCVRPGEAKCTYGTGCFLLENIGDGFRLSQQRLLTTLACSTARKPRYALEGSIFIGGAVVQWLRDNLRFISCAPDVESVAAGVPDSGGVVLVPAFTGLGAPHWDPYAAGMMIGIRRDTQIGHIARAAIESIAFQVADVLRAIDADTGIPCRELRVDGGAAANNLLMQFQADLLGIPVHRPAMLESTAQGAAYLAGLATGFWSSVDEIADLRAATVFKPQGDRAQMNARYARWQQAVERAKGWNAV